MGSLSTLHTHASVIFDDTYQFQYLTVLNSFFEFCLSYFEYLMVPNYLFPQRETLALRDGDDGGARTDDGGARGYGVVGVHVGRWVAAVLGE